MDRYYGAIEAGGTKFVCAVGDSTGKILSEVRFPTTSPEVTLNNAIDFFQSFDGKLEAAGIGSFGPLDLNHESETFGYITATPKPGWSYTDVVGPIKKALSIPIGFDTDVNAAALGEVTWGAARGLDAVLYLTIGTGIGGGAVIGGKPVHGLIHPEMGHIRIPNIASDHFKGHCPFHEDCFEGLASGPALTARWKIPAEELPVDHEAWEIEAQVIAHALHNFIMTLSPQKIILGGGVMKQRHLFPRVHQQLINSLQGYVQAREILKEMQSYVVPPALEDQAGILGALVLAMSTTNRD